MRIIVPVKPLAQAKSRLGTVLSAGERAEIMRGLLDRVIAAAREVAPVSVVTADADIAARSRMLGAEVIDEGEVLGLDAAARLGVCHARRSGEMTVMILAADLPDVTAEALDAMLTLARPGALVIGPSRDGGTNALILSPQVLNEIYSVVSRKQAFAAARSSIRGHLGDYMVWATAPFTTATLTGAWRLQDLHGVSFWDALLLASANAAGCRHFLTEDLNDGQLYGEVRVVDPFRHAPEDVLGRARR